MEYLAFASEKVRARRERLASEANGGAVRRETPVGLPQDSPSPSNEGKLFGQTPISAAVLSQNIVLEAFGNAKTVRNDNSSRFGKLVKLDFNPDEGIIDKAAVEIYLLSKSRSVHVPENERGFHIFHSLLKEAANLKEGHHPNAEHHHRAFQLTTKQRDDWGLTGGETGFRLCREGNLTGWGKGVVSCDTEFELGAISKALAKGGVKVEETALMLRTLAALLHLGNVVFEGDETARIPTSNGKTSTSGRSSHEHLEFAARLFGVDANDLARELTSKSVRDTRANRTCEQASTARDAVIRSIYGRLFDFIVARLNHHLATVNTSTRSQSAPSAADQWVAVLDIFGFEDMSPLSANSLEQLCINFCNERLHLHFLQEVILKEARTYQLENVPLNHTPSPESNLPILFCIGGQAAMPSLPSPEPLGLLQILEDVTRAPSSGPPSKKDESFARRSLSELKASFTPGVLQKSPKNPQSGFVIRHFAGPVEYDAQGFVEKNADSPSDFFDSLVESSSGSQWLRQILVKQFAAGNKPLSINSTLGLAELAERSIDLAVAESHGHGGLPDRSSASMPSLSEGGHHGGAPSGGRRVATSVSLGLDFLARSSALMTTLSQASGHFIRCIKPNDEKKAGAVNASRVQAQLRVGSIMEVVSLMAQGYPCRMPYETLSDTYKRHLPESLSSRLSAQDFAELVLDVLQVPPTEFALGATRVFFRFGALERMEELRVKTQDEQWVREFAETIVAFRKRKIKFRLHARLRTVVKMMLWIRRAAAKRVAEAAKKQWKEVVLPRIQRRAAVKLQSWWRMQQSARSFQSSRSSALAIQRVWRGHVARLSVQRQRGLLRLCHALATPAQRHVESSCKVMLEDLATRLRAANQALAIKAAEARAAEQARIREIELLAQQEAERAREAAEREAQREREAAEREAEKARAAAEREAERAKWEAEKLALEAQATEAARIRGEELLAEKIKLEAEAKEAIERESLRIEQLKIQAREEALQILRSERAAELEKEKESRLEEAALRAAALEEDRKRLEAERQEISLLLQAERKRLEEAHKEDRQRLRDEILSELRREQSEASPSPPVLTQAPKQVSTSSVDPLAALSEQTEHLRGLISATEDPLVKASLSAALAALETQLNMLSRPVAALSRKPAAAAEIASSPTLELGKFLSTDELPCISVSSPSPKLGPTSQSPPLAPSSAPIDDLSENMEELLSNLPRFNLQSVHSCSFPAKVTRVAFSPCGNHLAVGLQTTLNVSFPLVKIFSRSNPLETALPASGTKLPSQLTTSTSSFELSPFHSRSFIPPLVLQGGGGYSSHRSTTAARVSTAAATVVSGVSVDLNHPFNAPLEPPSGFSLAGEIQRLSFDEVTSLAWVGSGRLVVCGPPTATFRAQQNPPQAHHQPQQTGAVMCVFSPRGVMLQRMLLSAPHSEMAGNDEGTLVAHRAHDASLVAFCLDGDACPFCARASDRLRLREPAVSLRFVDKAPSSSSSTANNKSLLVCLSPSGLISIVSLTSRPRGCLADSPSAECVNPRACTLKVQGELPLTGYVAPQGLWGEVGLSSFSVLGRKEHVRIMVPMDGGVGVWGLGEAADSLLLLSVIPLPSVRSFSTLPILCPVDDTIAGSPYRQEVLLVAGAGKNHEVVCRVLDEQLKFESVSSPPTAWGVKQHETRVMHIGAHARSGAVASIDEAGQLTVWAVQRGNATSRENLSEEERFSMMDQARKLSERVVLGLEDEVERIDSRRARQSFLARKA